MDVTLVIPAHNAAEYLYECLVSIACQSYSRFRVLIVEDGSTDATAAIAEDFCRQDTRFSLIRRAAAGGVSAARNIGIDRCSTELIGFVDADDCLHPDYLAVLVEMLVTTASDVAICGFERGERFTPRTFRIPSPEVYNYEDAMRMALYQKRIMNSPWGMLMHRRLLGADIRFREGIRYEDLDAFYRFFEGAGRIAYIPTPLYFYRRNSASFMEQWTERRLDVLDVTDRIVGFMRQCHPSVARAAEDRRFAAHYNMLLLMLRHKIKNPAAIERCRQVIRQGRLQAITDPHVRLKNKLGALLSLLFHPWS